MTSAFDTSANASTALFAPRAIDWNALFVDCSACDADFSVAARLWLTRRMPVVAAPVFARIRIDRTAAWLAISGPSSQLRAALHGADSQRTQARPRQAHVETWACRGHGKALQRTCGA